MFVGRAAGVADDGEFVARFELAFCDAFAAELAGAGPFAGPCFGRALWVGDFEEQQGVRVLVFKLGDAGFDGDGCIDEVTGRPGVVRPKRGREGQCRQEETERPVSFQLHACLSLIHI